MQKKNLKGDFFLCLWETTSFGGLPIKQGTDQEPSIYEYTISISPWQGAS